MNIAIVDDKQEDIAALEAVLHHYAAAAGITISVRRFSGAAELLEDYRPFMYTVVFMDIYMDKMTGMEAAEAIRKEDSDTLLIFLTTSGEHRAEAFRIHAYDYIEKPVSEAQIYRVMDDILKKTTIMQKILSFTFNRDRYILSFSDITAVVSHLHNVEISDRFGNTYTPRMPFSSAADELLPDRRFLLITRGVIVNMDYIQGFEKGVCSLSDGTRIPRSLHREKELENIWQNYIFASIRGEALDKMNRAQDIIK